MTVLARHGTIEYSRSSASLLHTGKTSHDSSLPRRPESLGDNTWEGSKPTASPVPAGQIASNSDSLVAASIVVGKNSHG